MPLRGLPSWCVVSASLRIVERAGGRGEMNSDE
jgi:hypothetical protein